MQVMFASSHVGGDFSSGRLSVDILRDDPACGVTRSNEVFFEDPTLYWVTENHPPQS